MKKSKVKPVIETPEQMQARWAKEIAKAGVPDEKQMRESAAPTPKTEEELLEFIAAQIDRPHDYGTCCYAMSLAATAAFNFVADKLGVTGFQAGCASMDVLKRTKGISGPFIILKMEDALYPQYNLPKKLSDFMDEVRPWLQEQAKKKLAESADQYAHRDVIKHWEKLAKGGQS